MKKIFTDNMDSIKDEASINNKDTSLRGKVKFLDDEGNLLFEKDNLIVLRGRVFALEKMFNDDNNEGSYDKNLNREIVMFKIGTGGAPENNPFQPYTPEFSDLDIAQPIPFRVVDGNDADTTLTAEEENVYYDAKINSVDSTLTEYYGKRFDQQDPIWEIDLANNEVYKKMIMKVDTKDFRTVPTGNPDQPFTREANINELGLYFAFFNDTTNKMEDVELFSRLTFSTEPLSNLSKSITIEYYIFG